MLLKGRALSAVQVSATEKYYLFDGATPPLTLAHLDDETLDTLGRSCAATIPASWTSSKWIGRGRGPGYVSATSGSAPPIEVGCGRLALNADGRPDHAFVARLVGIPSASTGDFVEAISLERQEPFGLSSTADTHFVLGVAPRGSEVLVNRPDGSVRIAVEPGLAVRLLACDDGADTSSSAYRARLQIGSRSLVSAAVRVKAE